MKLRHDDRGAVMVIGLFMAMFLIGAMWTVVGLGDALVYRDKVQEVADHVAFTSATVHARGMNFIAVINLVMLAIVAVYIVIDVIRHVLDLVADVSDGICATAVVMDPLAVIACEVSAWAEPAAQTADSIDDAYKDAMKPILIGLSWTQTATAMVAPYGGTAAGIDVASNYHETGFAASLSMIPGFALTGGLFNGSYSWSSVMGGDFSSTGKCGGVTNDSRSCFQPRGLDSRIGLPVMNEKMNKLCIYAGDQAVLWLEDWLSKIPLVGLIFQIPGLRSGIASMIASAVTDLSCDEYTDGFWNRDGPKAPYSSQAYDSGASDWNQVYGFVFGHQKDVSENKVALGMGPKGGFGHQNTTESHLYQAEAEFFFDCDQVWSDASCNRPPQDLNQIPHAMYSMRWMARLRRVHYPDAEGLGISLFSNVLTSGNVLGPLKGKINGSGIVGDINDALGKFPGGTFAQNAFGALTKKGNGSSILDNSLQWLTGKIPNMVKPPSSSIIH